MTTRTKSLANVRSTTAAEVVFLYTCPAAKTAIVKEIRFRHDASATNPVEIIVVRSGVNTDVWGDLDPTRYASYILPAYLVLEPEDILAIYVSTSTGGGWSCIVSGAELDGVAP